MVKYFFNDFLNDEPQSSMLFCTYSVTVLLEDSSFCFQSHKTEKVSIDKAMSVCLSVCLSLTSDSLETTEVIISKLGMVTASDLRMHHMLIILTLTFIQGHTDLNHENKCLIIS